ncbi:MAG: VTT domain-containing protein [Opitutaceae bacterium]|nr:VTT domain-containing protein [Opitutaceae bacterium]
MSPDLFGVLVSLFFGTFVSEDAALISGGLLSSKGVIPQTAAILACGAGIFVSDLGLVLLGRAAMASGRSRRLQPFLPSEEKMTRARAWLSKGGLWLIFATRFVPGTRTVTSVAAGVMQVPFWRLVCVYLVAAAIWTPLVVIGIGEFGDLIDVSNKWLPMVAIGTVFALWGLLVLSRTLWEACRSWRARRLLYSRWQRLSRWEFWPAWALYVPLAPFFVWFAARRGGALLFTCANPAIDAGGGIRGESKSRILEGLDASGRVATWALIGEGADEARVQHLLRFMAEHALSFPVVLKPDQGERGAGVEIVRSEADARRVLSGCRGAMIAQRYIGGREYGLFHYRFPGAGKGRLFAITDKRMVSVIGDGVATLETLILRDERAVCMAAFFLRKFEQELNRVPAAGEKVTLTELGTHCRGALFLDGQQLASPQLEDELDRISHSFPGFHLGRYDVRCEDEAALARGEFFILELNGVTSEPTSMYDPRHGLWHAWGMLAHQWSTTFAIGAANKRLGHRPLRLRQLWVLLSARTP